METPPITPALEEPKRNNTLLIVGIVVVVLCCCCALVIALGWRFGDCLTNPTDPALCPLASTLINTL